MTNLFFFDKKVIPQFYLVYIIKVSWDDRELSKNLLKTNRRLTEERRAVYNENKMQFS